MIPEILNEKGLDINERRAQILNEIESLLATPSNQECLSSHNLFDQIYELTRAGESFAVATVVRVEKPISAKPGDKAIIKSDGTLQGWVGGGCAQDTVIREAKKVIREGEPRRASSIGRAARRSVKRSRRSISNGRAACFALGRSC